MSQQSRKLCGLILLAGFLGHFLCTSIFPHTHTMKGVVIVHSHFYNIFEKSHHQHSKGEIIHIDQISHAFFTAPAVCTPTIPHVHELDIPTKKEITHADVPILIHFLLRAPPAFVAF